MSLRIPSYTPETNFIVPSDVPAIPEQIDANEIAESLTQEHVAYEAPEQYALLPAIAVGAAADAYFGLGIAAIIGYGIGQVGINVLHSSSRAGSDDSDQPSPPKTVEFGGGRITVYEPGKEPQTKKDFDLIDSRRP